MKLFGRANFVATICLAEDATRAKNSRSISVDVTTTSWSTRRTRGFKGYPKLDAATEEQNAQLQESQTTTREGHGWPCRCTARKDCDTQANLSTSRLRTGKEFTAPEGTLLATVAREHSKELDGEDRIWFGKDGDIRTRI